MLSRPLVPRTPVLLPRDRGLWQVGLQAVAEPPWPPPRAARCDCGPGEVGRLRCAEGVARLRTMCRFSLGQVPGVSWLGAEAQAVTA